jgi:Skp family chaperone for outer membrane proteins
VRYVVKRNITVAVLLLFSGIAAYFATSYFDCGRAHTASIGSCGNTKIAVLDGARLKQDAKCFRAHDEISDRITNVLSRIRKSEAEFKDQHEKLGDNKKLSQRQRAIEISKLEMRWAKISEQYKSEMLLIREKEIALSKLIQRKVDQAIRSVAEPLNIEIVINKTVSDFLVVFYNSDKVEITDDVIRKLDEELPSVDLESVEND